MQCRTTIGLQPAQCAVHVLPSLQCSEAWLVQGGYCRATCKLCAVPKTNAAGAASTPAAEVRGLLCICMSAADATTTMLLLPCSALLSPGGGGGRGVCGGVPVQGRPLHPPLPHRLGCVSPAMHRKLLAWAGLSTCRHPALPLRLGCVARLEGFAAARCRCPHSLLPGRSWDSVLPLLSPKGIQPTHRAAAPPLPCHRRRHHLQAAA